MLTFVGVLWASVVSLSFAWLLPKALQFIRVHALFGKLPGGVHYHFADPEKISAHVLPAMPPFGIGDPRANASPFRKTGTSIIASTPLLNPKPMLWVADPRALKTIFHERSVFQKQKEQYEVITFYGPNIVSLEGPDWKRHQDVVIRGFKPSNNVLVWAEAARCVREWFSILDGSDIAGDGVMVDASEVMTRLALLVFSGAAFGRKVSLMDDIDEQPPPGYKLTFRTALTKTLDLMFVKGLAPGWMFYVPFVRDLLVETSLVYSELRRHLLEMAAQVRNGVDESDDDQATSSDLFRLLVLANDDTTAKHRLSDEELLSNIYTLLIAGYETTANTLAFALAYLALHPDCQRKLQQEVDNVWPDGLPLDLTMSYRDDLPKMKYAEAVFRETLRLRPAQVVLHRIAAVDTTLKGTKRTAGPGKGPMDETYDIFVPKGCGVWIDIWAAHLLEDYWGRDSEAFRPERFIDTATYSWPRDAYVPFIGGPRVCIGQRFALVEGVSILAHVARLYDICVPPALAGLPHEEQREQLLRWRKGVATIAVNAKVVLKRRNREMGGYA